MALGINTNIASLNAQNQLGKSQGLANQAMERLSSGLRINSAKDDAAGLAISTRMDTQVRGFTVAQRNANDAISMVQTAEGALGEVVDNLQRIRELAVQAANDTNGTEERAIIKTEIDSRIEEINRLTAGTKFNGVGVLDGSAGTAGAVVFQVGAGGTAAAATDQISITFKDLTTDAVPTASTVDTAANAAATITAVDAAIKNVSDHRGTLGATQNRMESVINNLSSSIENASASQARILDADFAAESAKMAKANVLQQAGISVLAQANARPNQVLSLLQ